MRFPFGKNIFEEALRLYAGAHVVELVRRNGPHHHCGEEIEAIMLSQDLKPFTRFSEKLTPAHLVEIQAEYLDRMTDCLVQHEGVIDHIRGDSILSYWESRDATAVISTVRRAIEIGREISAKWAHVLPSPIIPLHGVDYSKVLRGTFGSKHRLNYSLMGDAVNFTMRLCSMNQSFQTQTLFSSRVRSLASNPIDLRFVESIVVKGRAANEELYTLDQVPRGSLPT
jgi:adenylate cyclase